MANISFQCNKMYHKQHYALSIDRWLKPLFKIGYERELDEDDIYAIPDGMQSAQNTETLAQEWDIELKRTNPSIIRVILRLYGYKAISVTFLFAVACVTVG